MKKQTISFTDEAEQAVETWRKTHDKIPTFNEAVNTMLEQYTLPLHNLSNFTDQHGALLETKQERSYKNPPEVRTVLAQLRREQRAKHKQKVGATPREDR